VDVRVLLGVKVGVSVGMSGRGSRVSVGVDVKISVGIFEGDAGVPGVELGVEA
jgi:hypothetical protein